jgi:hypothetical protein
VSTDWGFYCEQCDAESETWFNNGEDLLRQIYAAWPQVRAIQEITGHIDITVYGYTAPWAFLRDHDGHLLALCDEYGGHEPLNPDDATRSFTMRFEVTGAERKQVQAAHKLKHLPDGVDVRRIYEAFLRENLHKRIQYDYEIAGS